MDFSNPHVFTVSNSFTKGVYRDVYPAVDPKRPELSQKGKVIMITGASRGIGKDGIAPAFAQAGASAIIITSRNSKDLEATSAAIKQTNPSTAVLAVALDLSSESSITSAFSTIAKTYPRIDTLVNNAGIFGSDQQFISSANTAKWWTDFEVNVRGTMLVTRNFLSQLAPNAPATVIFLSSGAGLVTLPGISAYSITKLADLQLASYTAAENPSVHVVAIHPGIIPTDMATDFFTAYAKDTPALAGAVINWAATPEVSGFLKGRYISVNWDAAELLARKQEIVENNLLTVKLNGLEGQKAELLS